MTLPWHTSGLRKQDSEKVFQVLVAQGQGDGVVECVGDGAVSCVGIAQELLDEKSMGDAHTCGRG